MVPGGAACHEYLFLFFETVIINVNIDNHLTLHLVWGYEPILMHCAHLCLFQAINNLQTISIFSLSLYYIMSFQNEQIIDRT